MIICLGLLLVNFAQSCGLDGPCGKDRDCCAGDPSSCEDVWCNDGCCEWEVRRKPVKMECIENADCGVEGDVCDNGECHGDFAAGFHHAFGRKPVKMQECIEDYDCPRYAEGDACDDGECWRRPVKRRARKALILLQDD